MKVLGNAWSWFEDGNRCIDCGHNRHYEQDKSEKWLVRRRSTECEEFVEREEMVAHIVYKYKKLG